MQISEGCRQIQGRSLQASHSVVPAPAGTSTGWNNGAFETLPDSQFLTSVRYLTKQENAGK